ncbi:MAG: ribonuclease HII [Bdellovibrionaceae bacterium]|nr:ribonuclease HII [Pseudobdellovibrionaceae bacterium]
MLKSSLEGGPVDHLLFFPKPIIGVDEVGRGCLAGNVYAAAVILDDKYIPTGLADSKALSAKRREVLSKQIWEHHQVGLGIATVEEIEELNILQASLLAMQRAVQALMGQAALVANAADRGGSGHVLVDGVFKIPDLKGFFQTTIIQGDSRAMPIAAASIVAKVARDQEMLRLDQVHPQYEFAKHKGYSTLLHKENIKKYGPCPLHRRTFAGVKEYVTSKANQGKMG